MPLTPPPARLLAVSAIFGTLFLAGCVAVVDSRPGRPGPGLPPGGEPQICTREYQPVCASRGRDERTFGNRCEARAAGYRIEYRGRCRGGSNRPDRPGAGRPDRPQVCTMEYAPVCARKGGQNRTYANSCHARGEGARVVRRGAC